MSSESAGRPRIRIIHHLARSGGTLISRCIASMGGVVLLSEIHPLGVRRFDPLRQAHAWYGLLTTADLERVRRERLAFTDAIGLIAERCADRGLSLVLRDWSHLDYTGVPFVKPSWRSQMAHTLARDFELVRTSTVRHPLDQWLSLSTKPAFVGRLDPEQYLCGVERFALEARATGFSRYEDFTHDPDPVLQSICAALDIGFDPAYRERWAYYSNVTGDVAPGRAGQVIEALPRQAVDPAVERRIQALPPYRRILELLGYPD
jgi:hypothetical protein